MLIYKINASYGDRFLRVGGIVGKVAKMWPVIVADVYCEVDSCC